MRPRKLELEGFTAFRDPQEIDFTELDLFVITGPTGAGKTSLLDAMALALYGQVPRMGKHNLGQLVTHGKPEARVLFEFSIDGDVYRIARRLPRSGSQQGRLERLDGDAWVDSVDRSGIKALNEATQKLVKLDFESFCKAVVLPQGDFAKFLKGEPSERRQTLVALLGLGHYERMARIAGQRERELRIRGEQTRTIIERQFADATPESLAQTRGEAEAAARTAGALGESLGHARGLAEQVAELGRLNSSISGLAARSTALAGEFEGELKACEQAEESRIAAAKERDRALEAVTTATDALDAKTKAHEHVLARTGPADELARLLDAVERLGDLETRAADATAKVETARTSEKALAEKARAYAGEVERLDAAAELARTAETDKKSLRDQATAERDGAAARLEAARQAANEKEQIEANLIRLENAAEIAKRKAEDARAACDEAEAKRDALSRENHVVALASGLTAGDPCPVCARPLADHPKVDANVERRLTQADEKARSARAKAARASSDDATARAQVSGAQDNLTRVARTLDEVLGGASDLGELEALVSAATGRADAAKADAAAAEEGRIGAENATHAARLKLAGAEERARGASRDHEVQVGLLEQATKDLRTTLDLLRGRFGDEIPVDAKELLSTDRAELASVQAAVDAARADLDGARKVLAEADALVHAASKAIATIDVRLQELRTRAETIEAQAGDLTERVVLSPLPVSVVERDTRASDHIEWCLTAADVFESVRAQLDKATAAIDSEAVELAHASGIEVADAHASVVELEELERAASGERIRAEERAARLADRVGQRTELEAGISADSRTIAVLDVLATELRADHFTDYVIQETLDALALHASDELLRISGGRYSLVSENGHFSVIDHVNADERRSVKTLSGGETFMASLSLALALSKHVSELAGEGLGAKLEAVFIDEGFGSLDPETLEEVIDALERLREDELLVGVISHVPALAYRIRAGLEVRKDGGRSVVVAAA